MKFKKTLATIVVGAVLTTSAVCGFFTYHYFQIKPVNKNLMQQVSDLSDENNKLNQDYNQLNTENEQLRQNIEDLGRVTQRYDEIIRESKQLTRQNNLLTNENQELKKQQEEFQQDYQQLEQQIKELKTKHGEKLKEFDILANAYHIIAKQNKELKSKQKTNEKTNQQEKQTDKETKPSIKSQITKQLLRYETGCAFPYYQEGYINNHGNWQSFDSLDKKGWQIISNKKTKRKTLSFRPTADFQSFSPQDNYATLHLHSDKPISFFTISGAYNIYKNGLVEISISGDNKNWKKIEQINSRKQNPYNGGWTALYYPEHFNNLNITNDIYIRHSAGATSNKDYLVEIVKFSAKIVTK